MRAIINFLLQIVLIFGPVVGFWLLKQRIAGTSRRLLLALGLSLASGAVAVLCGATFGFQPTTRSGRALSLEPIWLFTAFGGGVLVVLLLMTFMKTERN